MYLLEHDAKELLSTYQVPVPAGAHKCLEESDGLEIPIKPKSLRRPTLK